MYFLAVGNRTKLKCVIKPKATNAVSSDLHLRTQTYISMGMPEMMHCTEVSQTHWKHKLQFFVLNPLSNALLISLTSDLLSLFSLLPQQEVNTRTCLSIVKTIQKDTGSVVRSLAAAKWTGVLSFLRYTGKGKDDPKQPSTSAQTCGAAMATLTREKIKHAFSEGAFLSNLIMYSSKAEQWLMWYLWRAKVASHDRWNIRAKHTIAPAKGYCEDRY